MSEARMVIKDRITPATNDVRVVGSEVHVYFVKYDVPLPGGVMEQRMTPEQADALALELLAAADKARGSEPRVLISKTESEAQKLANIRKLAAAAAPMIDLDAHSSQPVPAVSKVTTRSDVGQAETTVRRPQRNM